MASAQPVGQEEESDVEVINGEVNNPSPQGVLLSARQYDPWSNMMNMAIAAQHYQFMAEYYQALERERQKKAQQA